MKSRINAGHRVGIKARSGAIIEGLEADPWHCLSFKKMIHAVSQQNVYLGTSAQPAEWKAGPRKGKAESPRVMSLAQDHTRSFGNGRVDRPQGCPGFLLTALVLKGFFVFASISDMHSMTQDYPI